MRRTRPCPPINPNTLVVGIDIAKETHVAVALAGDGRSAKPLRFSSTREGFESLATYAKNAVARTGALGFVVALEPTGHYGATLLSWLAEREIPAFSVQPGHCSRMKSVIEGASRKTDPSDARVIAGICRDGYARPYRSLTGPFALLRVASHQRQQLVKRRCQVVNRLHRHVDVVFPELRKLFPKVESRTSIWVLRTMPTPSDVLRWTREELSAGLHQASRWQLGEKRADELLDAARRSVGVSQGLAAHRLAIGQLLDELVHVLTQISQVEAEMQSAMSEVPYAPLLQSIPRLGAVTTATLLGEFGDFRNFQVAKQLIAFAGLSLVESSSGQRQGRHHIGRNGRAYARQILYLAALRVGWGVLAEPRRRKVEERRGEPTKAAVANMARLLRVMHALVRDTKPFEPERFAPADTNLAA